METKYKLVSNKCVNSNWKARFLADENEEWCQCSFGECKVKVAIENNGHPSYVYILTEKELASLQDKEAPKYETPFVKETMELLDKLTIIK